MSGLADPHRQEATEAEGTQSSHSLARGSRLPPSASFSFFSWIE
jgi:hypothetical protein